MLIDFRETDRVKPLPLKPQLNASNPGKQTH
jgi:hypothetical protein